VALNTSATAVVLISDLVSDDVATAEMLSHIVGGAPVLVTGVGDVDAATGLRIAGLTGGQVLSNVTPESVATQVTGFLAERARYDYRLEYDAPAGSAGARQVTVSLKSSTKPVGGASYTVPSSPVVPDGIAALYLSVETDGRLVTRRLAGGLAGTPADREAVRGALFGSYVLGVEAHPPSLSILLDEHLEERLQRQAAVRALRANDTATIARESQRAFPRTPAELRFFAAPYLDEAKPGDVTFVDGLTVTLHSTRPVLNQKVVRKIDMLPLVPRRTVVFAGGDGYPSTLDRTCRLAVAEYARFAKSTHALLKGVPLAVYDPNAIDLVLGPAWAGVTDSYRDYDILAPATGSPVAFWAVHRETGEVIGGLSDGGGSGEGESVANLVQRLDALLDAAERAGTILGFEGISVWTTLESIKMHAVANAIALFEGEPSVNGDRILEQEVCQAGINQVIGQVPGLSDLNTEIGNVGALQRILSILSGREAPPLPDAAQSACNALLGG
jgi:hypothetical protein